MHKARSFSPAALALAFLAAVALPACETLGASPERVSADWVDAESATFAAVAPTFLELLRSECGPSSEFAREQLEDLVGDWALRIRAHGGEAADLTESDPSK